MSWHQGEVLAVIGFALEVWFSWKFSSSWRFSLRFSEVQSVGTRRSSLQSLGSRLLVVSCRDLV